MLSVKVVGVDAVRGAFKAQIGAFQKEQWKAMGKATQLMSRKTRQRLRSGPLRSGSGRLRLDAKGRRWGPLYKSVRTKVRPTRTDLIGVVRYSKSGFYGRFHETGVDKTVTRTMTRRVILTADGRFVTLKALRKEPKKVSVAFRLPARPVLGPVAQENAAKAVEILGESYGVFTGRTAVG